MTESNDGGKNTDNDASNDEIENPFPEDTVLHQLYEERIQAGRDFMVLVDETDNPPRRGTGKATQGLNTAMRQMIADARKKDLNVLVGDQPNREWQCAECGFVIETALRPVKCPDCNCLDSARRREHGPHARLFILRTACSWFD